MTPGYPGAPGGFHDSFGLQRRLSAVARHQCGTIRLHQVPGAQQTQSLRGFRQFYHVLPWFKPSFDENLTDYCV